MYIGREYGHAKIEEKEAFCNERNGLEGHSGGLLSNLTHIVETVVIY